jgi:cysteine desulfurase
VYDNSIVDTIYLDHNATTPTHPEVVEAMARCWREGYANPASQHQPGQKARRVVEDARDEIAEILGANVSGTRPDRLIFTSGGTEANNLAVFGIAQAGGIERPAQVIVSAIEHASVLEPAQHLLDLGWRVDSLGVTADGVVRAELLAGLLRPETRLVSVMLGNHETGALQPVAELARVCNEAGVPMHTDAVQVAGKLPMHFRELGVAAVTVAAHKFQGPLGIGALLVRDGVPLDPLHFGGHQQWGLRPGTECVPLAVGMATALRIWRNERDAHLRHLVQLRDRFEAGLRAGFPELVVNGSGAARLPQTSNVAFAGLDGQVLLMALDMAGIACSVGSACSSGSSELSPTLLAMGLPKPVVASSLRFSLGAITTEAEIDEAVGRILLVVNELRAG